MQPRIQDFARLSVVTYTTYPALLTGGITMAQVIDEIGAHGYFAAVDVTWISDPKARAQAVEAARSSNLSVLFAVQPYQRARKLNLAALDNAVRVHALKICKQAIDQALEWDACAFSLLSGPDPGPDQRPAALQQFLRSLDELCAYVAAKAAMPILLETWDRKPFAANQLLGPTSEAVELARQLRSRHPDFGLVLNLAHLPLLEETPASALETAKDCLSAVRIGNCVLKNPAHPAYGNQHPPLAIPDGEIGYEQLQQFLSDLFRIGFLSEGRVRLGQMSFDVAPLEGQHPAEVVSQTKEMLDSALLVVRPPETKPPQEPTQPVIQQ